MTAHSARPHPRILSTINMSPGERAGRILIGLAAISAGTVVLAADGSIGERDLGVTAHRRRT